MKEGSLGIRAQSRKFMSKWFWDQTWIWFSDARTEDLFMRCRELKRHRRGRKGWDSLFSPLLNSISILIHHASTGTLDSWRTICMSPVRRRREIGIQHLFRQYGKTNTLYARKYYHRQIRIRFGDPGWWTIYESETVLWKRWQVATWSCLLLMNKGTESVGRGGWGSKSVRRFCGILWRGFRRQRCVKLLCQWRSSGTRTKPQFSSR